MIRITASRLGNRTRALSKKKARPPPLCYREDLILLLRDTFLLGNTYYVIGRHIVLLWDIFIGRPILFYWVTHFLLGDTFFYWVIHFFIGRHIVSLGDKNDSRTKSVL